MPVPPKPTFENLSPTKRERIIRTVLEEFSENGYQKTSINRIVGRLGIAKGSIFQYFKDKENLFLFVFGICLDQVKGYLKNVRDDTARMPFFDRLGRTLRAGVRFLHDHPLVYRLYLRVLFESQIPFRQDILVAVRQYSHDFLRGMVVAAQERGEIRKDLAPDVAAFILDAVLDRFLQAQCVEHLDAGLGLHAIPPDETEPWVEGIVETVRRGIGVSPETSADGG